MAFAAAIFVSAFLLFQVQPVIAKFILPWYGGSASVWSTCMLFFQAGLLVGYGYAHLLTRIPRPAIQGVIHVTLLVVAMLCLPITPSETLKPTGSEDPVWGILRLLGLTIGAPYVLLSSTGPLLQKWFSLSAPGTSPYRLYALSNLGSLLGLLSYPFLFEPMLGLQQQSFFWSIGFGLFGVLCALTIYRIWRLPAETLHTSQDGEQALGWLRPLIWILLAGTGSLFLISATNKISQDVAVIPFLWIVPLSLYLITFVIAFDSPRWYDRRFWLPLFIVSQPLMLYLIYQTDSDEVELSAEILVTLFCAGMFLACMVLHGELARRQPAPRHLTHYFLLIAFGGALGGVFVNFAVPAFYTGYWEIHTALFLSWLIIGMLLVRLAWTRSERFHPVIRWVLPVLFVAGLAFMGNTTQKDVDYFYDSVITAKRNFYGVISVAEDDMGEATQRRSLIHGVIKHGTQFTSEELREEPTSYYGRHSGIGLAIRRHPKRLQRDLVEEAGEGTFTGMKVGMIGLGVGTIARYGREGDLYRFYEINPEVTAIAESYFSFLGDSDATIEVLTGDGRITLERELKQNGSMKYDVLAVDAFSGDAIPVHLITREAMALYLEHLAPDGILALHVTNKYIDLMPVVKTLADQMGLESVVIEQEGDRAQGLNAADWILITRNMPFLRHERVFIYFSPWPVNAIVNKTLWTDDYSALLPILK